MVRMGSFHDPMYHRTIEDLLNKCSNELLTDEQLFQNINLINSPKSINIISYLKELKQNIFKDLKISIDSSINSTNSSNMRIYGIYGYCCEFYAECVIDLLQYPPNPSFQ